MNDLAYKIYCQKTIQRIEKKIKLLGISNQYDALSFLNTRFILSVILFIAIFVLAKRGYLFAPIFTLLFYYISEKIVFDMAIKKRGKKLEKESLFFFEILILTLESGRNLKSALELTTTNVDSEISEEFKKTLEEVKMGKSLDEALEGMKKRVPSETINNAILNMIQSSAYGNDILDSMYTQIDFLRNKQLLDIKAYIAKLPTVVSIISVLFFIPIMFLIILAPLLIKLLIN